MLDYYMKENVIENTLEKMICDLETGIHSAMKSVWPGVKPQGCRFHFGQALQRNLGDMGMIPNCKNPSFHQFFRSMLVMPMVRPRDIKPAIRELRAWKMDTDRLETDKHKFLDYFENTWVKS